MTGPGIARTRLRVKEWKSPVATGADVAPPRASAASPLAGTAMTGGYEGAERNRRLFAFRPSDAGPTTLTVMSGAMLRARSRHLARNNPYVRKGRRVFISKSVSTGFGMQPLIDDPTLRKAVQELWAISSDELAADGLVDFNGMLDQVTGGNFDGGEMFGRFLTRPLDRGLAVPLQVQLLESEFCPLELNMPGPGGNPVRAGIQFDASDNTRRLAYAMWCRHPGEIALPDIETGWEWIPAADVVHCFEPVRPGQIRGVSWLAAAIVRAFLIDQYEDAELERKKVAALFAGFIKKTMDDDSAPLGPQDQPAAGSSAGSSSAAGEVITGLSPGILQVLFPGEDVVFSNPADVGPNFEAFMYRSLLALCAAMDMPYFAVTGDLKQANYSSLRMGLVDLKESIETFRRTVLVFQFCRQVYRRWFSEAVLAGALPLKAAEFNRNPGLYLRAEWQMPQWTWVDPLKEAETDVRLVRAAFKSRESAIIARGGSLEAVDAGIVRSNESLDANGIVADSDPRRTNLRGSGPPPEDQPPAEKPDSEKDAADEAGKGKDTEEEEAA